MPACLPAPEAWLWRGRTLRAMAMLALARLVVAVLPFRWWRATLGQLAGNDGRALAGDAPVAGSCDDAGGAARRIAAHVERGAARLPFATKCLPRAMALCWLLRRAGIGYVFKIAVRPRSARPDRRADDAGLGDRDNLHAWVEAAGATVIGALPGPWLVVLVLKS